MSEDDAFLRAILASPKDDGLRLVYADWLEEQGGPVAEAKVEFLRLTAQLTDKKGKEAREKRLQELAAGLDTDWLAVVSRLAIENCHGKQSKAGGMRLRFDFLCDRRWEDLRTTDNGAIRFCDACRQNVHYCDTITEARRHATHGHCVAVDLGVIRRENDLELVTVMTLGRPSPESVRKQKELMQPDPVSAERDRQKREKKGAGGSK